MRGREYTFPLAPNLGNGEAYSGRLAGPGWHLLLPPRGGAYLSSRSRWNVSPSSREPSLLEWRDLGQQREVAIVVEDRETMPEGARGDQAIDS